MPLIVNGWTLLFHDMMLGQIKTLADAVNRLLGDPALARRLSEAALRDCLGRFTRPWEWV